MTPADRTLALSVQLIRTHQTLRDRLDAVRAEVLATSARTTT